MTLEHKFLKETIQSDKNTFASLWAKQADLLPQSLEQHKWGINNLSGWLSNSEDLSEIVSSTLLQWELRK